VGRVVEGEFVGRGLAVVVVSHRVWGGGGVREGGEGLVGAEEVEGEMGGVGGRERVVVMADGRVVDFGE
jgi:hypothetical protein